jgi:hypothetical protein
MIKSIFSILCISIISFIEVKGQYDYWQQKADYVMNIDFNASNHTYKGDQTITFTNNSPDELDKLYYHLYLNAFQPGSEMDERSRNILDADPRVGARISKLSPKEIGFIKPNSLTLNGKKLDFKVVGTILEVKLNTKIKSKETVKLQMQFDAQVPLQIRRTGRNNKEGIDYSMAQWYPKLCEYDYMGWHPNPYVAREFYGIWGNFDVNINIDSKYVLGGTGSLVNANEIGYGYAPEPKNKPSKLNWKFSAKNVHDFMWAADPDYKHTTLKSKEGVLLHFLYQENDKTKENWEKLPKILDEALTWMNKRYGKYPYPSYSFIQGGDGGMEYAMSTLITGERSLNSLVGVAVHEWMHSWYQNTIATNEALYPWMDEGFTSFGTAETTDYLVKKGLLKGKNEEETFDESIRGYTEFARSIYPEPLTKHADHYETNSAYGISSYTKGALTLLQLEYIMGKKPFEKALLKYYDNWKFKHPHSHHFFGEMEKESGLVLDWFQNYWVNTIDVVDYKIDTINGNKLMLERMGPMPMPIEISVVKKDGSETVYYIPLVLMRGEKVFDNDEKKRVVKSEPWAWGNKKYTLSLSDTKDIRSIQINPKNEILDINLLDNIKTF